jgi:hypothetical protein
MGSVSRYPAVVTKLLLSTAEHNLVGEPADGEGTKSKKIRDG